MCYIKGIFTRKQHLENSVMKMNVARNMRAQREIFHQVLVKKLREFSPVTVPAGPGVVVVVVAVVVVTAEKYFWACTIKLFTAVIVAVS